MAKKILAAIIFLAAAATVPAQAQTPSHQLSGNGDIIVDVRDELGGMIYGATVTIRLPMNDGLYVGSDVLMKRKDGLTGASGDNDNAGEDGDVEFAYSGFSIYVTDGDFCELTVTRPGYVDYTQTFTFDAGSLNVLTSANQFTVKVTLKRQAPLGTDLAGGTVKIYNGDGITVETTVEDGDAADSDGSNNGVIYIAQDPDDLDSGPNKVAVERSGFIYDSDSSYTISGSSQTDITFSLEYPFVISAEDELGNVITLTTAATVTGGGDLTQTDLQADGGTLYWAATSTIAGSITVTQPGYVESTTTLASYAYSETGPQATIVLDGTNGPAMKFAFKITATPETGAALTLADSDSTFTPGAGLTTVDERYDSGAAYIAAYGAGALTLVQDGFVATSTTVTYDSSLQDTIDFSGVMYALKVIVYDEAGDTVNGCTVTYGGDSHDAEAANVYYLAPASTAGELSVAKAGDYTATDYTEPAEAPNTSLEYIVVSSASQTVVTFGAPATLGETPCTSSHTAGAGLQCTGLLFPLKVILYDELGNDTNMATATVTFSGGAETHLADTNRYFWTGSFSGESLSVAQDGYKTTDQTDDAALGDISADPANRTVITMATQTALTGSIAAGAGVTTIGVKYGFKVTAEDEFGHTLTLEDPETQFSIDPAGGVNMTIYAVSFLDGTAYLAADNSDNLILSHNGFSDSTTTLPLIYDDTQQQDILFDGSDGPPLGYNVLVAVFDELDNPIDASLLEDGTFTLGGFQPGYIPPATNVMYFAIQSAGALEGYLPGFVDTAETGGTALADINPGTISKTEIILKGAVPCDGASVAADTQEVCGALQYNLKLASAFTELDAPIDIDGDETVALYSDAGCSVSAAAASDPFFFSGAWYAAAASGTTYYTSLAENGFITSCDSDPKTPDGTSRQLADFTTDDGDALKYNVKLDTVYTETGAILDTMDGAAPETLALYTNAACSAAAGDVASGPFFINGAWYAAAASGSTYYAAFTEPGYMDNQCAGTPITPDGVTRQVPGFSGGDSLVYNLLVDSINTEIDAPAGPDGNETVLLYTDAGCVTPATPASGPVFFDNSWYIAAASGTDYFISVGKDGYVTTCDLTQVSPAGTAQLSPSFSGADGDGLKYNIRFDSAFTELDAPLDIGGDEGVALYSDSGCSASAAAASGPFFFSGAWYAAAASGTAFYTALSESGYVTSCDATAKTPDGTNQAVPDFSGAADGLKYNIKFSAATNQLNLAMDIDGNETFTLYTGTNCSGAATVASGPFFIDSAWYAAIASGTPYFASLAEPGYVDTCDDDAVFPIGSAQVSPSFSGAAGDGPLYTVKVSTVHDELMNSVDVETGDTVALYSTAGCSGSAATPATGPVYDLGSAAWYIGAETGVYYTSYRKDGYVDACDEAAVSAATDGQVIPTFFGDGLMYGLVVSVADQYEIPLSGVTITHGGTAPKYSDQGADGNLYYFDTAAAAGLAISKSGYKTIENTSNSVEPGGYATGQTFLTLSGIEYGPIGTISSMAAGTDTQRNGLFHQFNAQLTVEYVSSAPTKKVQGLGDLSNFFFKDESGNRVSPEFFSEVNHVSMPGVYQFKVATSAVSVQVKSVDIDDDPWVDALDSDDTALPALSDDLTDCGSVSLYPAADYIALSPATGSFLAGTNEAITITAYDNDGAPVATGPHSFMDVQVTISGGAAIPPSQKDIVSTTLSDPAPPIATLSSGASDTSVSGSLSSGSANVVITDKIASGDTPVVVAAAPASSSITLPGFFKKSSGSSVTVYPESLVGDTIVVIDPSDTTTDATATVRIEIQDGHGNMVDAERAFQVMLTESENETAGIVSASHGSIGSGAGSATASVISDGGYVLLEIRDSKAETIKISTKDIQSTPGDVMDSTSIQYLTFSPGAPAAIAFADSVPTTGTVGTAVNITCYILDAGGNRTASTDRFTISATGAATGTASFSTPLTGAAIAGVNSGSITVRADAGAVTVPLTETAARSVTLSITNTDSLSYAPGSGVFDTMTILFSTSPTLRDRMTFLTAPQSPKAGDWKQYTVQLQDRYGNPLSLSSNYNFTPSVATPAGHQATARFSASSSGSPEVTELALAAGQSSLSFYFMDTLAGQITLQVASVIDLGVDPATLADTVLHADPVAASQSGVAITETTGVSDSAHPTSKKNTVSFSYAGTTRTILEYTYTDSASGVIANGSQRGIVTVFLMDRFGNPISGEDVLLIPSFAAAAVFPESGAQAADSNGKATFYVSSTALGSAPLRVDPPGSASFYGKESFTITFIAIDNTPPTVEFQGGGEFISLADGDYMDPTNPSLVVYIEDPGTSPSGININSAGAITIKVDGLLQSTTTTCDTSGGVYTCTISWTNSSALARGTHNVELTVKDRNGNQVSKEWNLMVEDSALLKDVLAGGSADGVFDPRRGDPLRVSFQVPRDGTYVTLDIYNRSGRLVYSESGLFDAGYNEFEWFGRVMDGGLPGNGIYLFRLTAGVPGAGTTTRTGKFAVFKP